jgi:hypothetical protein
LIEERGHSWRVRKIRFASFLRGRKREAESEEDCGDPLVGVGECVISQGNDWMGVALRIKMENHCQSRFVATSG